MESDEGALFLQHYKDYSRYPTKYVAKEPGYVGCQTCATLGLGLGKEALDLRVAEEGLNLLCVPTSKQTETLAERLGISLTNLDEHPQLDLAIDGADQVDPRLDLIKGGGAALAREKVIDAAAALLTSRALGASRSREAL
jgi:ribose 5-phosphate isomerase A